MAYTPSGALTNGGKTYKDMKYDAWGRLVEVRNQSSVVQAAYRYNGVGHRITWQDDADNDADVDANDPVYHLAVTEGGSMLAIYRGSDANVKEQIYLHLRGLNGWPSVKCDGETEVIVVDADRSTAWSAAADTVTETRSYLLTNQRGDVVTVISDAGRVRERPRYSAYGVPMLIMRTDWDADGDVDSGTGAGTDQAAYEADYFAGSPPARADYNLDGTIDPDDLSDYIADRGTDAGGSYGYGRLSSAAVGNRKGFGGWEHGRTVIEVSTSVGRFQFVAVGHLYRTMPLRASGPSLIPPEPVDKPCPHWFNPPPGWAPTGPLIPGPTLTTPTEYLRVCCRQVRGNPDDYRDSLNSCFAHCELRNFCPSDDLDEIWIESPVLRDNSPLRTMPDGTPCSRATNPEIIDCTDDQMKRPGRFPYQEWGNNCQTDVIHQLGKCCLRSTWKPDFYSGPLTPCRCVEWGPPITIEVPDDENRPSGTHPETYPNCLRYDCVSQWQDETLPPFGIPPGQPQFPSEREWTPPQ